MATPKDKLNEIINYLDENQMSEVINFVEFLRTKRNQDFWSNIPEDDEPVSGEELKAI